MNRQPLAIFATLVLWLTAASAGRAGSWVFQPSYFSHDDQGQRVAQYEQPAPSYARVGENYLQSGYRHNHTELRVRGSADNTHVVETWGDGEWIRPYGEWLFPYRAGATPYGPWGNPQGPWTMPFDSWVNPYGLMQHDHWPRPYPPYGVPHGYGPMPGPGGYGGGAGPGYGPAAVGGSAPPMPPAPGK